jgi:hypothetical protein
MTMARFTGTLATAATDDTVEHAARTMRDRRGGSTRTLACGPGRRS